MNQPEFEEGEQEVYDQERVGGVYLAGVSVGVVLESEVVQKVANACLWLKAQLEIEIRLQLLHHGYCLPLIQGGEEL